MNRLLDHIERMEQLRQNEWQIDIGPKFNHQEVKQLLALFLEELPDKYMANELRKRGYVVVKPIIKED